MKCTDCEDGKVGEGIDCSTCSGTGINGTAVEVEETEEVEAEDDTAEETAEETE